MRKFLFFLVTLSTIYFPVFTQPLSQTRTASFLNNLNDFRDFFGDQNYPRATAADVATDDNRYASTAKLGGVRDSGSTFSFRRSVSVLALQGFGFTIPNEATIVNIAIKLRRFETGTPSVGDNHLTLMQSFGGGSPGGITTYGVTWTKDDDYAGKVYPATETEYTFSQSGSGNNGGGLHDQAYQWTPAIVNQQFFGVRIQNYAPIGRGPVVINYDLVEVTVNYTLPLTLASPSVLETSNSLKQPHIYPNPFTTSATIQFTASESGKAVVELYNISGAKVRTLFSGNVIHGQSYNVTTGDAKLARGTYVYLISIGKQKQMGRIMKLE